MAPIIEKHCASCHRPGGIAPFSLLTYGDARPRANAIRDTTAAKSMPPWKPTNTPGLFAGDRSLSAADLQTIERWVASGVPEGPSRPRIDAPKEDVWQLGPPDLVITMPEAFEVPAEGADQFKTFVLRIPVTSARFVEAIEFRPGNARVVHHANLGIDRTLASRRLDEQEAGPGYTGGILPSASYPSGHMLGWTPGQEPRPSPEGTAWRVDPGQDFVMQLHLQPTGQPERLQASVGFHFTDRLPTRVPVGLRLGSETIDIPAGAANYIVTDRYVLPADVELTAIQGHAHNLARRMEARALLPDKTEQDLLTIADWDFRWQDIYRYAKPPVLPKGTVVTMRFTYDNSASNRRNPNQPPRGVVWGQNTADEMGDLWLQVLPLRVEETQLLAADIGRKMQAEDVKAFTEVVGRDPKNPLKREALANAYLNIGQSAEAIVQLRELILLDPSSSLAHYNLGLALTMERRYADAIPEFEKAIALNPEDGDSHNNLGAMFQLFGKNDEALRHYREAVRLRPDSAEARANLGRVLMGPDPAQAAVQFQRAIALRSDYAPALSGLAWIHATSPDVTLRNPAAALRLARLAVALTGRRDVLSLDALGAALAVSSQFPEASVVAREAVALATTLGAKELAAQIQAREAQYQRGTPFVEQSKGR